MSVCLNKTINDRSTLGLTAFESNTTLDSSGVSKTEALAIDLFKNEPISQNLRNKGNLGIAGKLAITGGAILTLALIANERLIASSPEASAFYSQNLID